MTLRPAHAGTAGRRSMDKCTCESSRKCDSTGERRHAAKEPVIPLQCPLMYAIDQSMSLSSHHHRSWAQLCIPERHNLSTDPPPLLGDNRLYHKLAIARAGAICESKPFQRMGFHNSSPITNIAKAICESLFAGRKSACGT